MMANRTSGVSSGKRRPGLVQRGLDGGAGEVGQLVGDLLEAQLAGQVAGGDGQQAAAMRQAQAVGIGRATERRQRHACRASRAGSATPRRAG